MKKKAYSEEFKQTIVQKILMPGGPSISEMAEKIGVHHTSIRNWIKSHGKRSTMETKEWTPEAKLQAIIETAGMTENQLGEFLRANGLHFQDVENWKQGFYDAQKTVGRPKIDPELAQLRVEKKELTRDLNRKEKALAEMSARVILLKKSQQIFGGAEDEE